LPDIGAAAHTLRVSAVGFVSQTVDALPEGASEIQTLELLPRHGDSPDGFSPGCAAGFAGEDALANAAGDLLLLGLLSLFLAFAGTVPRRSGEGR
jgi:hypothetical protein